MRFSVLSSGSKANSTFFEAGGVRLLIDCGLSATKTEERLRRIGIDPATLSAILITHEHSDHIHGVSVMSRRFKLPVFANVRTGRFVKNVFGSEQFETGVAFDHCGVRIAPFSIAHDAVDPVGFRIEAEGLTFVQVTDLGKVTPLVRESVRGANAIVLESNHDEQMLMECGYPWELKQRIASSHGHLSNVTAAGLAQEIVHPELWQIVLGHLSENSNTPEVALRTFHSFVPPGVVETVLCAGVASETPLLFVEPSEAPRVAVGG
jgi:phosphoribosyl 1,2-cyclic phosphodiesterase